MSRLRNCDNPAPSFGGKNCSTLGADNEMKNCPGVPCPSKLFYFIINHLYYAKLFSENSDFLLSNFDSPRWQLNGGNINILRNNQLKKLQKYSLVKITKLLSTLLRLQGIL